MKEVITVIELYIVTNSKQPWLAQYFLFTGNCNEKALDYCQLDIWNNPSNRNVGGASSHTKCIQVALE